MNTFNQQPTTTSEFFNRMPLRELKESQGSSIDFIKNPKTGKLFFTCGSKQGYVSKQVQENLDSVKLEDLNYAEISINGGEPVPTIMMRSTENVLKSL